VEEADLVAVVSFDQLQPYSDVVGPFDIDLEAEVVGLVAVAASLVDQPFVDAVEVAAVVVASSFGDVVGMDYKVVVVASLVVVVELDLEPLAVEVGLEHLVGLVDSSSSFVNVVAVVVEEAFAVDKDCTFVVAVAVEAVDSVPFDSLLVVVAFVVAFAAVVVVVVELLLSVFYLFLVMVITFAPLSMVYLGMLNKLNKLNLYAISFEDLKYLASGLYYNVQPL
jgi:hypothetical protein